MIPGCDEMLTQDTVFDPLSAFTPFLWVGKGRPRPHRPGARRNPAPPGTTLSGGRFSVRAEVMRLGFAPNEPGQQPGHQRDGPHAEQPPGDEREPRADHAGHDARTELP